MLLVLCPLVVVLAVIIAVFFISILIRDTLPSLILTDDCIIFPDRRLVKILFSVSVAIALCCTALSVWLFYYADTRCVEESTYSGSLYYRGDVIDAGSQQLFETTMNVYPWWLKPSRFYGVQLVSIEDVLNKRGSAEVILNETK